jgi:hypothetical protein
MIVRWLGLVRYQSVQHEMVIFVASEETAKNQGQHIKRTDASRAFPVAALAMGSAPIIQIEERFATLAGDRSSFVGQ